jgi:hypothetical protein
MQFTGLSWLLVGTGRTKYPKNKNYHANPHNLVD